MKDLKDRIRTQGKYLVKGILKVDGFINHQVDPILMKSCGSALASTFSNVAATKILTAEISGIAPALMTAMYLNLPVVYARKHKPVTMPDEVLLTLAPSHTKGRLVELIISPEYLQAGEKALIIDDFLASGQTILGLANLAEAAGADIVGIGTLIEKTFEDGRSALSKLNVPIKSLAPISEMSEDNIVFAVG